MTGRCHICLGTKPIEYCPICQHWFCSGCREKWFWRGLEAVKQIVRGKRPGCCGPRE